MHIKARQEKPWEALFVFHMLNGPGGDQTGPSVADRLAARIAREAGSGLDFGKTVTIGKRDAPFQVAGRFVEPGTARNMLTAWNGPDGTMSWMCFYPNHGIAVVSEGQMDWCALICFQCANAGIVGQSATLRPAMPNRLIPISTDLQGRMLELLPERPFPLREM